MNLKFFGLIIAVMFIALLGIIFIQWHFISNTIRLNEEQFERHVISALKQVANKIEREEEYQTSQFENGFSLQKLESDTQGNYTHLWIAQQVVLQTSTINPKMTAAELKISLYDQPLEERLDLPLLDKLLKHELFEYKVRIPFSYGVYSNHAKKLIAVNNRLLKSDDNPDKYSSISRSPYHVALLSADPTLPYSPGDLFLYFPDKNTYVWGNVGISVFLSAVFVLLILLCFGYTVGVILKQKKLSEMKTDFVNNMTHEFKTPIATISLATDSITSPSIINNPDKIRRFAGIITAENKRMNGQVEKVLQMAQLDRDAIHLNVTKVNLNEIIEHAIDNISLQVSKRDGIVTSDLKAQDPIIEGDQNHIANILNNLLDNANKYSPDRPIISVTTASKPKGVEVTITDSGIGISKESQKQIFDKFYRVHTGNVHDIKGFGLGLAYVKALVTAHNGTINLKSDIDKGSSFTLFFPYHLALKNNN